MVDRRPATLAAIRSGDREWNFQAGKGWCGLLCSLTFSVAGLDVWADKKLVLKHSYPFYILLTFFRVSFDLPPFWLMSGVAYEAFTYTRNPQLYFEDAPDK